MSLTMVTHQSGDLDIFDLRKFHEHPGFNGKESLITPPKFQNNGLALCMSSSLFKDESIFDYRSSGIPVC